MSCFEISAFMNPLRIEQIYTSCLAQGSYYIVSGNEAVIIDPLRETEPYIKRLQSDQVKLRYIFETHFHADFVSGHLDLSGLTHAPIVFGPNAKTDFDSITALDGQEFKFGNCTIKLIHTPGHTLESSVLLLLNEEGKEVSIFTGDTLFIGDVGRPDLAQNSDLNQEDLAGLLYDSLRNKIMPLPPDITIYPAHGAGSACGKNMSNETSSTLGEQLKTNYALRANQTKDEFIKEVLFELPLPPGYFKDNVRLNKQGYKDVNAILVDNKKAIPPAEFECLSKNHDIIVLDTRDPNEFYKKFIPGSLNIGLNGDFAPWVGNILTDTRQKIILVSSQGKEEESIMRLSRVGFDSVLGYLEGGISRWVQEGKPTDHILRITAEQFSKIYNPDVYQIIDVRRVAEFAKSHLDSALNMPLDRIHEWSDDFFMDKNYIIHCAGGYRSMIASSILKAKGFHRFYEIEGGYKELSLLKNQV